MFPLAGDLPFFRDCLHPISQDPPVNAAGSLREKESGVVRLLSIGWQIVSLGIVPETDRQMELQPLFENASRKIPTH